MAKKKIKGIYKKDGMWYIKYKDPLDNKWKGRSSGLPATRANEQNALKLSSDYNTHLARQAEQLRSLKIKKGTIQEAYDHFKYVNINKNADTKKTYDYFFDFFKKKFSASALCTTITKNTVEDFLSWLSEQKYSRNTKYGINKNLKKFLNFLWEYEYLPKQFILNRDLQHSIEKKEPRIFTDEDRIEIINNLDDKTSNFRILIYMLMYTGFRPSDILTITAERIDLEEQTVKFYSPKTGKWFNQAFHEILKPLLAERIKEVGEGKLFSYAEEKNAGLAFRRYIKQIGLQDRGYTLRTFRKDFISRGQAAGIPIAEMSKLVGHSDIRTTRDYYTYFETEHMHKQLKKMKKIGNEMQNTTDPDEAKPGDKAKTGDASKKDRKE